ncbi:MAG: LysR family transcriptional regulator [Ferrovibrionaceae bacterium]
MDVDLLQAFDQVAREGSFTRAAARLDLTQGAVSLRIQALEARLGGLLFRRGRRLQLTDRGRRFLPYARRLLAMWGEGVEAARLAGRGQGGHLSMAVLRSQSSLLMGPVVERLLAEDPGMTLVLREGLHHELVAALHDRAVDLAMLAWPNLDPLLDQPSVALTVAEPVVFAVSPALWPAGGPASIDAVLEVLPSFLLMRWWQVTPDVVMAVAGRARHHIEVPMDVGLHLALAGRGGGFFLAQEVAPHLAAGRLVAPVLRDVQALSRDIALVARSAMQWEEPAVRRLVAAIRAELARQGIAVANLLPELL